MTYYAIVNKADMQPSWFTHIIGVATEPRESLDGLQILLMMSDEPDGLSCMLIDETQIRMIDSNWSDSLPEVDGWEQRKEEMLQIIANKDSLDIESALSYIYYGN